MSCNDADRMAKFRKEVPIPSVLSHVHNRRDCFDQGEIICPILLPLLNIFSVLVNFYGCGQISIWIVINNCNNFWIRVN